VDRVRDHASISDFDGLKIGVQSIGLFFGPPPESWLVFLHTPYSAALIVQVRCLFRVTEYAQGYDPDLIDTQYWLYIFDTLPLALGIAVWAIVWPPKVLEEQVEFVGTDEHGSGHDYHMNTIDLGSKAGSQDSLIYERC
jgi:hypothetical protein